MALSDAELAVAIRVGVDYDELDAGLRSALGRLHRAGRVIVQEHTAVAPVDVEDEAVIRIVGYLWDAPNFTGRGVAFRESGAMSLVDPWKARTAAVVETGETDKGSAAEDLGDLAAELAALRARVRALEPKTYRGAVYSTRTLKADPAGLTEADFQNQYASVAVQGADLPASQGPGQSSRQAFAVPSDEGPLAVVYPLGVGVGDNLRFQFLPAEGGPEVEISIGGLPHFAYLGIANLNALQNTWHLEHPNERGAYVAV